MRFKDQYHQAHYEYVRRVIPLKIWHVRDQAFRARNPLTIPQLLDEYVDLFRLTDLYDGSGYPTAPPDFFHPEWETVKTGLAEIMNAHAGDNDPAETERLCTEYIWPRVEPVIEKRSRPLRKGPEHPFGCWRYSIENNDVQIHIANAFRPYSPFDKEYFPLLVQDLLDLLKEATAKQPKAGTVGCGSWMNTYPKFLKLFCPAWHRNVSLFREYGTSVGFWGQYVSRTGGFNQKNGEYLRSTGKHRFLPHLSSCGVEEEMAYLVKLLLQ